MEGLLSLSFTPTQHQLADICTKPLTGAQHRFILTKLGVGTPSNLRGGVNIAPAHCCTSYICQQDQDLSQCPYTLSHSYLPAPTLIG